MSATVDPNKLYFNNIKVINDGTFIIVNPNFACPWDNATVTPENKIFNKLPIFDVPILIKNKAIEYNDNFDLIMPCCERTVSLYIAVHKLQNDTNIDFCISVNTIQVNWWEYRK